MISIGLPAFKSKYLKNAIESVLYQTFSDFELIIVDDASPENISDIVGKFNDKRIRYYRNLENLGSESVVKNWNKCLEYAHGEYFVLFSDDDIYTPNFLEEMHGLASKFPQIDVFHCRVKLIDENDNFIKIATVCPEYETIYDFVWNRIRGFRDQYAPDFLVRTESLKAIGGFVDFPLAWSSDDATWFTLAKDKGIAYTSKILCNWRASNINISKIGDSDLRINSNKKYHIWVEKFISSLNDDTPEKKYFINSIRNQLKKRTENNIVNLLIRTSGEQYNSIFKIIRSWIRLRRKYNLKINILLRAVLHGAKYIYKNKKHSLQ